MQLLSRCNPSPRSIKAALIAACIFICIWGVVIFRPTTWSSQSDSFPPPDPQHKPLSSTNDKANPAARQKYAFATVLTGEGDTESNLENPYFMAARLLAYQLLHSPDTRSAEAIPLLVLVTENIARNQRVALTQDGAIVVPVESITRDWIHPKWERWSGVLAKLNIWNLTDYDKITFLDADTMLFHPIDDVFSDPAAAMQKTEPLNVNDAATGGQADPLPANYMIAGIHDRWVEANLPPVPGKEFYVKDNYMNAGFFVFSPSKTLFEYYLSLLDKPDAFDPNYPEQNLLNYAHRVDGRMPWKDIGFKWNQKGASRGDYENGLRSVHQKWWVGFGDPVLDGYVANITAEMREFISSRNSTAA